MIKHDACSCWADADSLPVGSAANFATRSPTRDYRRTRKKRAFGVIVHHAAALDAHDVGFEWAGVALKEALCMWLDSQPHERH